MVCVCAVLGLGRLLNVFGAGFHILLRCRAGVVGGRARAYRLEGTLRGGHAKGEIVEGSAMLVGSVIGGVIAQMTNLGMPYILRALLLGSNFVLALALMRDLGFTPAHGKNPLNEIKVIIAGSIQHGLRNPPVRWIMLAAPFTGGVTMYAFYAMQLICWNFMARGRLTELPDWQRL